MLRRLGYSLQECKDIYTSDIVQKYFQWQKTTDGKRFVSSDSKSLIIKFSDEGFRILGKLKDIFVSFKLLFNPIHMLKGFKL